MIGTSVMKKLKHETETKKNQQLSKKINVIFVLLENFTECFKLYRWLRNAIARHHFLIVTIPSRVKLSFYPVDTGRELNVHKTFNLRPVSTR